MAAQPAKALLQRAAIADLFRADSLCLRNSSSSSASQVSLCGRSHVLLAPATRGRSACTDAALFGAHPLVVEGARGLRWACFSSVISPSQGASAARNPASVAAASPGQRLTSLRCRASGMVRPCPAFPRRLRWITRNSLSRAGNTICPRRSASASAAGGPSRSSRGRFSHMRCATAEDRFGRLPQSAPPVPSGTPKCVIVSRKYWLATHRRHSHLPCLQNYVPEFASALELLLHRVRDQLGDPSRSRIHNRASDAVIAGVMLSSGWSVVCQAGIPNPAGLLVGHTSNHGSSRLLAVESYPRTGTEFFIPRRSACSLSHCSPGSGCRSPRTSHPRGGRTVQCVKLPVDTV